MPSVKIVIRRKTMTFFKTSLSLFFVCYVSSIAAQSFIAVPENSPAGQAAITKKLNTTGTTFLSSETIALNFDLQIAEQDIGFQSELFLVAETAKQKFIRNTSGTWLPRTNDALIPTQELTLSATEQIKVLNNESLPAGEYQVMAGYTTHDGIIKYTANPTTLVVFPTESYALYPVSSPAVLHDYLYQGAIKSARDYYQGNATDSSSVNAATEPSLTPSPSSPSPTSSTLLQETGVDEGDRIKTDGNLLFSLQSCEKDDIQTCLHSYRLQQNPARSEPLNQLQLTNNTKENTRGNYYRNKKWGELYLKTATETTPRTLIWLNDKDSQTSQEYPEWSKYTTETQIKMMTAEQPNQFELKYELKIDGALLSSRLVDGVLYLLTRKSRYYHPPYDKEPKFIKPPLNFFLPSIEENGAEPKPLLNGSECYIAPQNKAKYNQATVSIITAIPVDNPSQHQSHCIAGKIESFYASTQALYFATSRYPSAGGGNSITYDTDQVTDIHKFSLQTAGMEYRGSGQVVGHLGWEKDKKSFRFGEHNGNLRIATSAGRTWSQDSRTKVTVLKEDISTQRLQEIGSIDNLGKPGERLYAARFIGDRGYLVTFRVTDPLIVLDLSTPENPKILGELEINGYSDFLQPIGENYLLGIGKDAIPDERDDGGDIARGAWYQGVKLSLFDVSSAENLKEVNSVTIGKRGTQSIVSHDHHGVSLLEIEDNHYKLALPIELHDSLGKPNYWSNNPDSPSTSYQWTHTGLYVFDINTENPVPLQQDGKLITETFGTLDFESARQYDFNNDRAVIQNQTVHYVHGSQVISSEINNLK